MPPASRHQKKKKNHETVTWVLHVAVQTSEKEFEEMIQEVGEPNAFKSIREVEVMNHVQQPCFKYLI